MTLGEVLRRTAAAFPDKPALLGERCLTWSELLAEVVRVGAMWEAAGVRAGDPVAFVMEKRPEVVVGFLACAEIGAIYVPVNHKLPVEQVRDAFEVARVRAVVYEAPFASLVGALDAPLRFRLEDWSQSRAHAGPSGFTATPDTVCYFNYTSGSTGRPKGAVTTHRNILVNGQATADGLGFRAEDVYLGMFSVFAHPHELFHRSILTGGAFVIAGTLNPRAIAELVQRFRVTWMMAVPSFYEMLLDFQKDARLDLSSLRVLEAGGAYVSPEALDRMEGAFGARFLPVWGSTETSGVGIGMLADGPRCPGSTGRPIPGYAMRVVGEDGQDVAAGVPGEMWMKGEAVALGYVNQPEETAVQFQDGWYATRDLVRVDAEGFVWFVGRRSEMLKIGGIRVFPLEIEQVLAQHPEVRGVVVVRAEDRIRGEIARAVVQRAPGSRLTVRGAQAFCRARMPVYKVPRIVEFWRELPRLPNGKIDKNAVSAVPVDPARDEA